ncbi:hypothetical protein [Arthrobacter alkaliphilus]|uniref:hypothetical protein n=1 Tax=Arthrobacter alkaliphilus TaxID=369936 RepID=UPI001F2ED8E4|nr:hypothetical protein [Arthrobacter alkaliphilus]
MPRTISRSRKQKKSLGGIEFLLTVPSFADSLGLLRNCTQPVLILGEASRIGISVEIFVSPLTERDYFVYKMTLAVLSVRRHAG